MWPTARSFVSFEFPPKCLLLILTSSRDEPFERLERSPSSYKPFHTFELEKDKQYQQQYADMYFLRLTQLKPKVEKIATEAWDGFQIAGEEVRRVERVLDVRQGELCWVAGTVYMEMPLKPNILEDISKDVRQPAALVTTANSHSSIGYRPLLLGKSIYLQLARILQCWKTSRDA
jgi:hypothetical protein